MGGGRSSQLRSNSMDNKIHSGPILINMSMLHKPSSVTGRNFWFTGKPEVPSIHVQEALWDSPAMGSVSTNIFKSADNEGPLYSQIIFRCFMTAKAAGCCKDLYKSIKTSFKVTLNPSKADMINRKLDLCLNLWPVCEWSCTLLQKPGSWLGDAPGDTPWGSLARGSNCNCDGQLHLVHQLLKKVDLIKVTHAFCYLANHLFPFIRRHIDCNTHTRTHTWCCWVPAERAWNRLIMWLFPGLTARGLGSTGRPHFWFGITAQLPLHNVKMFPVVFQKSRTFKTAALQCNHTDIRNINLIHGKVQNGPRLA